MLILSRKSGEKVLLGTDIRITVVQVRGNRVQVGIEAPKAVRIVREELYELPTGASAKVNQSTRRRTHEAGNT